ncbi:unnamed protein product [Allacma fusca]|uniref:Glutathione S-transferase n=1 Tax=Allacma fusca TaxID=39272 RepID=A0A8J2NQK7_9HEXA|nr:unnamed protein product [Allacma fusca]
MPSYELIYFDVRALAEPIRWIFALAKVPLKDTRIDGKEWATLKETFPLGQLPVLVEDDNTLTQSYAIGRYLCKKFDFVHVDPFMDYLSDQVSEIVEDCRILFRELPWEIIGKNDPERIKELKEKLLATVFPRHLRQLEGIMGKTDGAFIAGDQITHGDFVLASWTNVWEDVVDSNILESYPLLKKQQKAVMELPEIQDIVRNRPCTFV